MNIFKRFSLVNKIIKAIKIIEEVLNDDDLKNIKDKAISLIDDVKKQVPEAKETIDELKGLFS